jgi:hypothetical protein
MANQVESELTPEAADSMTAAGPSDVATISTPETERPMLDVHAPHVTIDTWKSFFIHIATICIGFNRSRPGAIRRSGPPSVREGAPT